MTNIYNKYSLSFQTDVISNDIYGFLSIKGVYKKNIFLKINSIIIRRTL